MPAHHVALGVHKGGNPHRHHIRWGTHRDAGTDVPQRPLDGELAPHRLRSRVQSLAPGLVVDLIERPPTSVPWHAAWRWGAQLLTSSSIVHRLSVQIVGVQSFNGHPLQHDEMDITV